MMVMPTQELKVAATLVPQKTEDECEDKREDDHDRDRRRVRKRSCQREMTSRPQREKPWLASSAMAWQ